MRNIFFTDNSNKSFILNTMAEENTDSESDELELLKYSFKRVTLLFKIEKYFKDKYHDLVEDLETISNFDSYKVTVLNWTNKYIASDKQRESDKAKLMQDEFQKDAEGIRACIECYGRWKKDNLGYFLGVCNLPHLIVMAKYGNYRHWPAKVMSVHGDEVNVEFFGDPKTSAIVNVSCCRLYSSRDAKVLPSYKEDFKLSIDELKKHIKKIKDKFGTFKPAGFAVPMSATDYRQQLKDMIPGAFTNEDNVSEIADPIVTIDVESDSQTESSSSDMPLSNKRKAESDEEYSQEMKRKLNRTVEDIQILKNEYAQLNKRISNLKREILGRNENDIV